MTIPLNYQTPDVGDRIALYDLDCTMFSDGGVYRFTQNVYTDSQVRWMGHWYTPIDIQCDGFELNGQGTLPRPRLSVSNVGLSLAGAVIRWNRLQGAKLTRWRTFKEYLDDGPSAGSPEEGYVHYLPDIYILSRMTDNSKLLISWELRSPLDFMGQKIPKRQMLRDTCVHIYRYYDRDRADFRYAKATCPYALEEEGAYFTAMREPTTKEFDQCGKSLDDCKLRYPGEAVLPALLNPGLARTRIYK